MTPSDLTKENEEFRCKHSQAGACSFCYDALKKELAALRAELQRIQEIHEQEWLEVMAIVFSVLAHAEKKGFEVKESDAVKALDRGQMYVARLKSDLSLLRQERDAYREALENIIEAAHPIQYDLAGDTHEVTKKENVRAIKTLAEEALAAYPKKEQNLEAK